MHFLFFSTMNRWWLEQLGGERPGLCASVISVLVFPASKLEDGFLFVLQQDSK